MSITFIIMFSKVFIIIYLFACQKHYDMYMQIEVLFLGA